MNDHKADARISIQTLRGTILLHLPEQKSIKLLAGQLLTLDCGIHHDVEALEGSAFLLTVAWQKDTKASGQGSPPSSARRVFAPKQVMGQEGASEMRDG